MVFLTKINKIYNYRSLSNRVLKPVYRKKTRLCVLTTDNKASVETSTLQRVVEQLLDRLFEESYTYVQQRRVFAIALIYATGRSAAEILQLQKQDVLALFDGQKTTISELKDVFRETTVSVALTDKALVFLNKYKRSFDQISIAKKDSDFVFVSERDIKTPMTLDAFERDVSKLLREKSKALGMQINLRTLKP